MGITRSCSGIRCRGHRAGAAVGADGILRGMTVPSSRALLVRHAWPRRPNEPVGARSRSAAQAPSLTPSPGAAAFNRNEPAGATVFPRWWPANRQLDAHVEQQ